MIGYSPDKSGKHINLWFKWDKKEEDKFITWRGIKVKEDDIYYDVFTQAVVANDLGQWVKKGEWGEYETPKIKDPFIARIRFIKKEHEGYKNKKILPNIFDEFAIKQFSSLISLDSEGKFEGTLNLRDRNRVFIESLNKGVDASKREMYLSEVFTYSPLASSSFPEELLNFDVSSTSYSTSSYYSSKKSNETTEQVLAAKMNFFRSQMSQYLFDSDDSSLKDVVTSMESAMKGDTPEGKQIAVLSDILSSILQS